MINLAGYENLSVLHENSEMILCRAMREYDLLPVFIKYPRSELPSPQLLSGMKNEYYILQEMGCEGVVEAITLLQSDNSLALILKDAGYRQLREIIDDGVLDLKHKIKTSLDIAKSLAAIHKKGFLHRNICPLSILLSSDMNDAVFMNLQSCSRSSEVPEAHTAAHILNEYIPYISPEQSGRVSGKLDLRSDYYSLGVTLFELFTGQLPFDAQDALELIHCHLAKEPPSPDKIDENIPESVSAVILKLLAKNPNDRYQSDHGLIQDLKLCLNICKSGKSTEDFVTGNQDISEIFKLSSRLFGRKTEKKILRRAYDKIAVGGFEIIMVRGDPGCGKTTLVRSMREEVLKAGGMFISGKFDQFRRERPYSAIIQSFQNIIRQCLSGSEQVIEAWKRRIISAIGPNAALISEVIPELDDLIGVQPAPAVLPPVEARNRFDLTFKEFIKIFPSMEKPLVLFMDDLQWIDPSTMMLLKLLLEDKDSTYLMLVGAYRTDLALERAFVELLADFELSRKVETITLRKLNYNNVHGFVCRTLKSDRKRTEELAKIIYSRTGGNPLFLREYMLNLYRNGQIVFNKTKAAWEWDLQNVREAAVEGSVLGLMEEKIRTQPADGQDILKAAACIGERFDLRIVAAAVDYSEKALIGFMNMALNEGLLVIEESSEDSGLVLTHLQAETQYLSFMHDRVRQAAYSMLDERSRVDYHYRIGLVMLELYSEDELKDNIFDVAGQFSLCLARLQNQSDQTEVSRVFMMAGRKAKNSSAFGLADKYFRSAVLLLGENCWFEHYDLAFDLHLDWFECSYLNGTIKEAENIFEILEDKSTSRSDLIRANIAKIQLYFDYGKYLEAVSIGCSVLELYKVKIPEHPRQHHIAFELLKTRIALKGKKREKLINLPEMSSVRHQEIMRLLMYMIAPAYMVNKPLVFYMILKMIRISLKYGNSPFSAYGYIFYSMYLAGKELAFDKSEMFSRIAVDLNRQFKNHELEAKIYLLRGAMHDHCFVAQSQNVRTLEIAYQNGLLFGDKAYARYAAYFIVYFRFLEGRDLADVHKSADKFSGFIRKNKNDIATGSLKLAVQISKSLEGGTYTPGYLDDDDFKEASLLRMCKTSGSRVIEYWIGLSKIISFTFFGYHRKAMEYIDDYYDKVDRILFGMYLVPVFHFYSIINLAAEHGNDTPYSLKDNLKRIQKSLGYLRILKNNCPENFEHMYLLSKAEYARICGRYAEAVPLYEQAVLSCKKNGSNGLTALACELAARFNVLVGGKRAEVSLLHDACVYYRKWGALAKVKKMVRDHNLFQEEGYAPLNEDGHDPGRSGRQHSALDISTVLKASQAISGEIVLDRLLDKLMRIVIENAGAQKATLLLENKSKLELTAHAFVSEHGIVAKVLPDYTEGSSVYCSSIVNYVLRSRDNLVLRDAGAEGPFTIDPYIIKNEPKSILAMPVVNQQIMRGVLYLENNLSPGVFTEDRLEVLNLICSQATISIQNARLYSELRDSETQHRTLLESINVGVFRAAADEEGALLKGNRALSEMFGYDSWSEFIATPLSSLFLDAAYYQSILAKLSKGQPVRDKEVNMRRRDGTHIWVSMTAALSRDVKEGRDCIEGVLENITEKRKARELERQKVAADAANKAKTDFLASMSHEIRTPMNAILGMADMLWESELNVEQRGYVKLFKNAGENLLVLINDILDLSKIEAGQIDLEKIDFNLEELFTEIGSIFALRAQIKNIDFCWRLLPGVPKVITSDPTRLRQIIVNLVGNSLKFTEFGTITFEASLAGPHCLRVLIKDSGMGIPQGKMNAVFDTFSQADSSTTRNYGGTGLGLAICDRMVTRMGGGIFVSSEEGKGSTFAFTVNVDVPVQPEPDLKLDGVLVLLVEDDSPCCEMLCKGMEDLGAEVHAASDFIHASQLVSKLGGEGYKEKLLLAGYPCRDESSLLQFQEFCSEYCPGWQHMLIMEVKPQPDFARATQELGYNTIRRPAFPLAVAEALSAQQGPRKVLPIVEGDKEAAESVAIVPEKDAGTKDNTEELKSGHSILVVEDSEDNRMVIDLYLKNTNYALSYAENGKEGVDKYISGDFDIVLMDIQMPVMDGYEATRTIRAYEQENGLSEVPILALTANAFQEDEQKCLENGCSAHMAKPVNKKKLLRALESFMNAELKQ